MQGPGTPPRYIFIGGLHRSGTSLVNRLANALPGAGGIEGSPAPENEGVYLQGAIPHTAQSGKPMHFATDPAQHLTETSPFNSLDTRLRLERDWAPWFADGLTWRVEKSPVNLTRMRLLQQIFPLSQFIVVLRHPEAVAASVASWVEASPDVLHAHWIAAHDRLSTDLPFLHAVMILRYEDIIADPVQCSRRIAIFLGLAPDALPEAVTDANAPYRGQPILSEATAAAAGVWGYTPGLGVEPRPVTVQHPQRAVREAVERT